MFGVRCHMKTDHMCTPVPADTPPGQDDTDQEQVGGDAQAAQAGQQEGRGSHVLGAEAGEEGREKGLH